MCNPGIFGSIGYAIGSALGAFITAKDNVQYKRTILITDDGSLQ
jgi:TPP-dependent 2-oxoacid decarboxylase